MYLNFHKKICFGVGLQNMPQLFSSSKRINRDILSQTLFSEHFNLTLLHRISNFSTQNSEGSKLTYMFDNTMPLTVQQEHEQVPPF